MGIREFTAEELTLVRGEGVETSLEQIFRADARGAMVAVAGLGDAVERMLAEPAAPTSSDADRIVALVAKRYGLSAAKLRGSSRYKTVANARKVLYVAMRTILKWSYPEIGTYLNRDHTTIMAGVRSWKESRKEPSEVQVMQ